MTRLGLELWTLLTLAALLGLGVNLGAARPLPLGRPIDLQVGRGPLSLSEAHGYFQLRRAVFVDARSPEEFAAGHIDFAGNLPARELAAYEWQLDKVEKETPLIVYTDARSPGADRSVSLRLVELGYARVYQLPEGLEGWRARGFPLGTGKP